MGVRTFYWNPVRRRRLLGRRRGGFRVGNAGDLLNRDLVRHLYGVDPDNVDDEGRRLLLVGSVAHRALPGDVVAGVGTKGVQPPAPDGIEVRGVRGPITHDALAAAGFDLSGVRFQYDPGLLARELYPAETAVDAVPGRVIVVPHYRDRDEYGRRRGLRMVDIDCEPAHLAAEIARAELVYTSSLHGLVFAHAIGRPCVLIAPIRSEPIVKYQDYLASVSLPWQAPPDLDAALRARKPDSPAEASFDPAAFDFPSADELRSRGILTA